jgi:hypothetical protein
MNPILRPLMAKIGVFPTMILGKVVFLPLVYWLGMNLICLLIFNGIYAIVIVNNVAVIYNLYKETR